jgi:hypothetical protein
MAAEPPTASKITVESLRQPQMGTAATLTINAHVNRIISIPTATFMPRL